MIGLLQPILKHKMVAAVVGMVVALLLDVMFSIGSTKTHSDRGEMIFVAIVMAVFLGAPCGLLLRDIVLSDIDKSTIKE